MGCGHRRDGWWYYRGEWYRLPAPVCGDCGVGVNGCRKCGAFFSVKGWEYLCTPCLKERQANRPKVVSYKFVLTSGGRVVCPVCGGEDEHTNGSLFCGLQHGGNADA